MDTEEIILKPNPGRQEEALIVPFDVNEILYGGARGGGKTFAGLLWMIEPEYVQNPSYRGLVVRRNAEDLKDWLDRAQSMYGAMGAHITGNPAVITFPSGAKIRTGHLSTDDAYTKYQGHEYQKILIEELTQIPTLDRYLRLISSARSTVPGLKPQVFATTNPGGVGHAWVKERWVDPAPPDTIFKGDDDMYRIFIPATMDDNPVLMANDPTYVHTIEALKDTDDMTYRAWRFGDWDVYVGQVFREWSPYKDGQPYHVIHALPENLNLDACQVYIGFDWGYNDPTSFHWIAVCPEDATGTKRVYCYRELTGNATPPEEWADRLADIINNEPIKALVMPHDAYYQKNDSNTIEQRMRNEFARLKATRYPNLNVPMEFAESGTHQNRVGRQTLLHSMLAEAPDGKPYMQVVDTCRNLIRTLPLLPYSERDPETVEDKNGTPDHWYDSLTYALYYANLNTRLRGDMRRDVKSAYTFNLDNTIQRNANRFRNLGNDWRTL